MCGYADMQMNEGAGMINLNPIGGKAFAKGWCMGCKTCTESGATGRHE